MTPAKIKLLKWYAMCALLFWVQVYRFSLKMSDLPDFVYVNF